jgi:hypothetical protein
MPKHGVAKFQTFTLPHLPHAQVLAEGLGLFLRCAVTVALLVLIPEWGLANFCIAQLIKSGGYANSTECRRLCARVSLRSADSVSIPSPYFSAVMIMVFYYAALRQIRAGTHPVFKSGRDLFPRSIEYVRGFRNCGGLPLVRTPPRFYTQRTSLAHVPPPAVSPGTFRMTPSWRKLACLSSSRVFSNSF